MVNGWAKVGLAAMRDMAILRRSRASSVYSHRNSENSCAVIRSRLIRCRRSRAYPANISGVQLAARKGGCYKPNIPPGNGHTLADCRIVVASSISDQYDARLHRLVNPSVSAWVTLARPHRPRASEAFALRQTSQMKRIQEIFRGIRTGKTPSIF